MTDSGLPPIKGAATRQNPLENDDKADLTATRDISQSAIESDRALINQEKNKRSTKSDLEIGKIQKNPRQATAASSEEKVREKTE